MLDMKKLLTKMLTVKDVTPSSIGSFISTYSGYTVSNLEVKQYGKILSVKFTLKRNVAWGADSTGTVGVIASGYRPVVLSGCASATFKGIVNTDGTVYLRPTSAVSANNAENVAMMYILA